MIQFGIFKLLSLGNYDCSSSGSHRKKSENYTGVSRLRGLCGSSGLSRSFGILSGSFSVLSRCFGILSGCFGSCIRNDYRNAVGLSACASTVDPVESIELSTGSSCSIHKSFAVYSDYSVIAFDYNAFSSQVALAVSEVRVNENVYPAVGILETILITMSVSAVSNDSVSLDYELCALSLNSCYKVSVASEVSIVLPPAIILWEEDFMFKECFVSKSDNAHGQNENSG